MQKTIPIWAIDVKKHHHYWLKYWIKLVAIYLSVITSKSLLPRSDLFHCAQFFGDPISFAHSIGWAKPKCMSCLKAIKQTHIMGAKAYDSLPNDLLVSKLKAYGIDKNGLNLIHNYLKKT